MDPMGSVVWIKKGELIQFFEGIMIGHDKDPNICIKMTLYFFTAHMIQQILFCNKSVGQLWEKTLVGLFM